MGPPPGRMRRRLRFDGFEFRLMGVMTMGAEVVGPFPARKIPCSFPVDARLPIPVLRTVTFPAKAVTLREVDQLSIEEPQLVPVFRIVAVETPPHRLRMMELDGGVFILQVPLLPVGFHRGVTPAAGEHPLGHGRRRNGKFLGPESDRESCRSDKNENKEKKRFRHGIKSE